MRAVIQRVKHAEVRVDGQITGSIAHGLLIFLGVGHQDEAADAAYLAEKIIHLRIFEDDSGKMNLSVMDKQGGLLIVSQFTLYGDCRKGNRPGWSDAARPEKAIQLYEAFVDLCKASGLMVGTGIFQAAMDVSLVNDGPVTLILDSQKRF